MPASVLPRPNSLLLARPLNDTIMILTAQGRGPGAAPLL